MTIRRKDCDDGMVVELLQRPSPQREGDWVDGAVVASPGAGVVLADTGALSAGEYVFAFFFTTSGFGTIFRIEHRDAANAVTLRSQIFNTIVGNPIEPVIPTKLLLAEGERMRTVHVSSVGTPTVQSSVMYARLVDRILK